MFLSEFVAKMVGGVYELAGLLILQRSESYLRCLYHSQTRGLQFL
jgi:hypothetical protein